MSILIAQSAKQETAHRWRWQVWLEGPADELDQVERVVWLLHPTFPDPMRESTDRASGFRLEEVGWGEFKLRARIHLRGGKEELLEHDLRLGDESQRAPRKQPVVFISHAAVDAGAAKKLSTVLETRNVKALDAGDVIKAGGSWDEELQHVLSAADAFVAVIPETESPWLTREVTAARRMGVPVLPVRIHPNVPAPKGLEDAHVIDVPDLDGSANELSRSVHELFATRRSS